MVFLLCGCLDGPATGLGSAGRVVLVINLCSALLEGPASGLWLTGRFWTVAFLSSAGEAGIMLDLNASSFCWYWVFLGPVMFTLVELGRGILL